MRLLFCVYYSRKFFFSLDKFILIISTRYKVLTLLSLLATMAQLQYKEFPNIPQSEKY